MDRLLTKEKDTYVLSCADLLVDAIGESLPPVLKEITQALESNAQQQQNIRSSGKKQTVINDKRWKILILMQIDMNKLNSVLLIITTYGLSQRIVNAEVIRYLSRCLFVTDISASFEGFTKTLLLIIESLSGQQVRNMKF